MLAKNGTGNLVMKPILILSAAMGGAGDRERERQPPKHEFQFHL